MKVKNYQELIVTSRGIKSHRTLPRGKAVKARQTFAGIYRSPMAWEAETQILIAQRLDYLSESATNRLMHMAGEVGRLLNGLMASLRR